MHDWKKCWQWWSVQLAALLLFLDMAYEYLPVMQTYLPDSWVRWMSVAIIAGRIMRQQQNVSRETMS